MKKLFTLSVLMVFLFCLSSVFYFVELAEATDKIHVTRNKDGYQTIRWHFTANSSGAADCETVEEVNGMLWKVWLAPDSDNPISGSYDIDLYEVVDYDSLTTGSFTSDLASGLITDTTGQFKALVAWPTSNVAVGSRVKLNVTSATNEAGAGGSGKIVVMFAPTSSE
jgi:hypothetical protein